MAHRHGKGREKKKKESPAEKRKVLLEAIICMLCDKTDCVNKFQCRSYKTKEISTNIVDDGEEIEEDSKESDEGEELRE